MGFMWWLHGDIITGSSGKAEMEEIQSNISEAIAEGGGATEGLAKYYICECVQKNRSGPRSEPWGIPHEKSRYDFYMWIQKLTGSLSPDEQ